MKTRNGWVSNSSSTSFMICGILVDKEEINELAGKEVDEIYDLVESNKEIEYHSPPYEDNYFIGISMSRMGMDETRRQFESRVFVELQKLLPNIKEYQINIYSEGWYDG